MVTIVAKIMSIFRVEYRKVPPFFFDSNGGNGDKKNVNNFGHDRYYIFGPKPTFPVAVSLFVALEFVAYSDRPKLEVRAYFSKNRRYPSLRSKKILTTPQKTTTTTATIKNS